jgi:hypothetical protein
VYGKSLYLPIKDVLMLFSIPQATCTKKEKKMHFLEERKQGFVMGL